MMGEKINFSYVTEHGFSGDRTYALIDKTTGKVASAKNPRKWRKLFDFRSLYNRPTTSHREYSPIRITLPDGTYIFFDQDDTDYTLSKVLGRDVRLSRASSLHKPRYMRSTGRI
jgi:MOSC domain-containing protein